MTEIEGGNEGPDVGDLPAGRGRVSCAICGGLTRPAGSLSVPGTSRCVWVVRPGVIMI